MSRRLELMTEKLERLRGLSFEAGPLGLQPAGERWPLTVLAKLPVRPRRATFENVKYLCSLGLALTLALLIASPAGASDPPSYAGLWAEAITNERCAPREFTDFFMGVCPDRLTFSYFTKPNHPAHPGVIRRWPTQVGDSWVMQEEGWSFAPDSKQQLFNSRIGLRNSRSWIVR
jgi:hypothetical protein